MFGTCARGFEPYLRVELETLGASNAQECPGGVQFSATIETSMKICLWTRIANKIEILLGDTYAANDEAIYELGRKLPLFPWFSPEKTFCIHAHSSDPKFKNSLFLAMKLKDGIVDNMREKWSKRCSIDTERPDIELSLQVAQRRARVHLEIQGAPLNMRGYRRRQREAPIRETLAASMIAMSGWQPGKSQFIDPMCGSGTFAIEAALIATDTAPGIQRHFAFERLPFFPDFNTTWLHIRQEARERSKIARKTWHETLLARDIDATALDVAQNNAMTAGVSDLIRFQQKNVLELSTHDATIVTNPPYGERISVGEYEIEEFYFQLGRQMRQQEHSNLTIISSPQLLKKNLHMRPQKRIPTYNGPLPCEAAFYMLGKGH